MTLDSFNAFTVTVTPQSVLWKFTINICIIRNVNIFLSIGFDIFLGAQKKCLIERVPTPYVLF